MDIFLSNRIPPTFRMIVILLNDIFLLNITLYFSYFLRSEYFVSLNLIYNVSIISTLFYLILFFIFKIHKQYFRYFNPNSYQLYFKKYIIYTLVFGVYVLIQSYDFIPRSLILIFPSFFFFILIINRILIAKLFRYEFTNYKKKAIVFGFVPSIVSSLSTYAKIICFVDDKKNNNRRIINGIEIKSSTNFVKSYKNLKFDLILIQNYKLFNKARDKIRDYILDKNILVQKISSKKNEFVTSSYFDFNYFFHRKNKITSLGNIYKNKTILITGAGGSIGSNIVFQLLKTKFKKLILLDNSEYNLYSLLTKIPKKNIFLFI